MVRFVYILLFCMLSFAASAQCGMGVPSAGNPNCIPPSVQGSPYGTQGSYNQQPVQEPIIIRHDWADRWGAISADGVAGSLGFVTGYPNKEAAERAAVNECIRGGGAECRPEFSFYTSCAAFVIGNNGTSIFNSKDEETASKNALEKCEKEFGNCRVYKTACSHAEAVPIR